MQKPSDDPPTSSNARLLKGAAVVFLLLGGTMVTWGLDKWIRYPETRASQFGFEAPLWPAFVGFTIFGTAIAVGVFWSTARRIEAGEDLFKQRHRYHSDAESPSETSQSR